MPKIADVLEELDSKGAPGLDPALLARSARNVTSDSKEVGPGSIFVAVRGGSHDGHAFIPAAVAQGADLVVGEARPSDPGIPFVQVADSRKALARLAANFYDNPTRSMLVVGVTGTSGKTTTAYLLEAILLAAGYEVGVVGTVAFRYRDRIFPSTHTTPGAVELQRLLSEMRAAGCNAVVMEVSSHALKQHRTAYIAFDAAVFTNLSPEHLDFHPDMEDYFRSKTLLFTESAEESRRAGKRPIAAVNLEDDYGRRLAELLKAKGEKALVTFSLARESLAIDLGGIRGRADGVQVHSPLTGGFNGANILAALSVARALGIEPAKIEQGITALRGVPGRLERVANDRGIHVFVDYAHKPDALEKVLKTLGEVRDGHRLITVFGCGGDRDRTKRPVMGRLAVALSDEVYVTSDNPRTESPEAIIGEILSGMSGLTPECVLRVLPDRRAAIRAAIAVAKAGDIVLIAGKGHEDYQIIGTSKVHFDDREEAAAALVASGDHSGT